MNGVVLSASKTRLLRYVRSFTHSGCKPVRNLLKDCGEFLPALRNIHRLVLLKINIEHLGDEELHAYFSAFRETLTTLVLQFSTTSFSTFVALVNYFPNITSLRVGRLALKLDEGPVPTLSKSFGGKIWVHCSVPSGCELLDRLAMLDLEYDELIVETSNDVTTDVLESVLRVSAGTVRYLRLTAPLGGKHAVLRRHHTFLLAFQTEQPRALVTFGNSKNWNFQKIRQSRSTNASSLQSTPPNSARSYFQ